MFLGQIANYTSVSGTAIPFTTLMNTNAKVTNNAGVLSLKEAGLWNIDASLTLTGVAATVSVNVYVDGANTGIGASATIGATTDEVSVSVVDAVKTAIASYPNFATISLVPDTSGATISGIARVEYVR